MNDYRISPEAELDLAGIWDHIAADNPIAANGFIGQLLEVMNKLQQQPRMGRPRDDLEAGLRIHPHGNYLIVYHVKHNVVVVSRVIHGARDLKTALDL